MLKRDFVPVAIDQAYQRRQKDAEGEFYRKIAGQSRRNNFNDTTQGFFAATANGSLLFYNNNRDPDKVALLMRRALKDSASGQEKTEPQKTVAEDRMDKRYNPRPPEGGLVVRVHTKVLGGYSDTDRAYQKIMQQALGRDNLWISREEHVALTRGRMPEKLAQRIARFHLVDNTRGEPPMWKTDEIRSLELNLQDNLLSGSAVLQTKEGDRSYECALRGMVDVTDGKVTRFDVVAKGLFEGAGRYTRNPPPGKFPFAVSFMLADGSDIADSIPPQGSRGWVEGYLK